MNDYIQGLISSFNDKFDKEHQAFLSEKIEKFGGKHILNIHKELESYFIFDLPVIKCLVDYDYWTKGKWAHPHKRESIPALYCDNRIFLYKAHISSHEPLRMYYVSSQNVHHIKFYKRAPKGYKKISSSFNEFVKKYGERGA